MTLCYKQPAVTGHSIINLATPVCFSLLPFFLKLIKFAQKINKSWPIMKLCTVIPRLTSDPANEFFG